VISSFSAFVVIAASALLGLQILEFFGISLASFQVGGGMLLLTSALNMLNAQPAEAATDDLDDACQSKADGRQHGGGAADHSAADRPGHHVHRGDLRRKDQTLLAAGHVLVGYGVVIGLATALCFAWPGRLRACWARPAST
jgi:multiple antibiotic resistance protein